MRPPDAYQGVDETLQADVMRFMAIIAFCLIAILSLVRSLEPPREVSDAEPAAVAEPPPDVGAISRSRTPTPESPPDVGAISRSRTPEPSSPEASVPARPEPERIPEERPLATAGSIEAPPAPVHEARATPPPTTSPAPAAEQGLSLRFASDQDFLRLVNRGEIQVFAFRDGEVLSVSADFRFEKAPAPGRLHELLPETIPHLMAAALDGATNGGAYRWGVAIPPRMARQIQAHLDRGATGELIIDRFGEVRHHGA